jgi:hypothetical protein
MLGQPFERGQVDRPERQPRAAGPGDPVLHVPAMGLERVGKASAFQIVLGQLKRRRDDLAAIPASVSSRRLRARSER